LLCGVRPEFAKAMANLRFQDWLPAGRVFPEEVEKFSAILKAVRHVYELFEDNSYGHCLQGEFMGQQPLYYLVKLVISPDGGGAPKAVATWIPIGDPSPVHASHPGPAKAKRTGA
jgi:hypothetical protein